ncbi:hypothetical protein RHGRI_031256 [Rhododendron griersonianum]|uniref:Uncharacterized protein n=1 Tax=Rhododendron griersonianum TaxID=479676 RepID=A0AAV6IAF4_9ERIC|nr:hypothetical protein RHGRI_031256 [Rhododendron griersonianum]
MSKAEALLKGLKRADQQSILDDFDKRGPEISQPPPAPPILLAVPTAPPAPTIANPSSAGVIASREDVLTRAAALGRGAATTGFKRWIIVKSYHHLPMTPGKRKIPDSTPPPPLRRSKRLALCKDVAISMDQSTDGGGGDEENNINYSGDSYEEMSKSVSQGDTESESDGETDGQSESDCHSGAIKLPNLASFASRPVIEERSVALGKLRKMTRVPELLKDLGLHPICKYEGRANWTLVREFFAGINPFEVDQVERVMLSKVRGHTIRVTPDRLAQFKKIARPRETEKQYSYLPGVESPTFHDIWMTLCHGSWPPEDTEDNPNPKILLNILKKDFVLLHHIFWWNVHPKSPRRPGTIGKSEGQSKLHREVNNPASLEGLRDMILTVQENQISMWEKLKKVERVVCRHDDEDEDSFVEE